MREDEAQRATAGRHQIRNDRFEVMTIGAEAVQPHDAASGIAPGLYNYRLEHAASR
jgi:hypothetical protein